MTYQDFKRLSAAYKSFMTLIENILKEEEKSMEEDIVHCGECKHYGIVCNLLTALPTESDYCSWGERE